MKKRVIFIISELTEEEFLACKNSIENPEPLPQGQCRVSWETPLPNVERIFENQLLFVSTNTQTKRYFAIKILEPEEYYEWKETVNSYEPTSNTTIFSNRLLEK